MKKTKLINKFVRIFENYLPLCVFSGIMGSEPNYAILHPLIIPEALNVSFSKTIDSFQTHISKDF